MVIPSLKWLKRIAIAIAALLSLAAIWWLSMWQTARLAFQNGDPTRADTDIDIAAVLAAEFKALHGLPEAPIATERDYAREVHRGGRRIAALCLSGGGIRSASFALGVVQSLAQHGLLTQFHYLSTVSGGGYIGSWLQAWRLHAGGLSNVIDGLNQPGREPPELTGLRENSAYLTPKMGATSADTWAVIALYVRNLILNWAVLGPVFLVVLLVPWFGYDLMVLAKHGGSRTFWPLAFAGSLALVGGLHSAAWQRRFAPPPDPEDTSPPGSGQSQFLSFVLLPLQLAAILFALAAATGSPVSLGYAASWGAGVYLLAWASAWLRARQNLGALATWPDASNPVPPWLEAAFWIGCGALAGVLVVMAFGVGGGNLRETIVVGVGCFMLAILVPEILYVGFASYSNTGDNDREWLARSAGWLLAGAVVWVALAALVLYAGSIVGRPATLAAIAAAILSGGGTAVLGSSARTAATLAWNAARRHVPMSWLLSLGAFLFIAVLAVVLSALGARLLAWFSVRELNFDVPTGQPLRDALVNVVWDLVIILALAVFALGASFVVNVNRFSLHGVYRNRLIRAFLGAARRQAYGARQTRRPNPFTGFDQDDNPALDKLWSGPQPLTELRLFPVLNMALNLVSGDNPAWQERKAKSFTATPLHCGSARVGFRRTAEYRRNA